MKQIMQTVRIFPAVTFLLLFACSPSPSSEKDTHVASRQLPNQRLHAGAFHLKSLGALSGGGKRYLAEVGQSCQFEIRIGDAKATGSGDFAFAFASASLVRRINADCTEFLTDLAPALGYKGALPTPTPQKSLSTSLTILGTHQSRSSDPPVIAGSFSSEPPGDWTATKLFLAEGEGEVFLNLNEKEGVGEFSYKDSDYASIVVSELAKIMLPVKQGEQKSVVKP